MDRNELLTRYKVVKVFSREERIMSDVWALIRYAVLLTEEGYKMVAIGNSEFPNREPLPPLTMADEADCEAYEAHIKAEREAAEERRRKAEAEREARTIRHGKTVKVVRGRKVPKGTVGTVFWIGDGRWGRRLGIALDDEVDERGYHVNVEWVAASNCEVVL